MNTLEGQQAWCKRPRKTTEVVRSCAENERGAHSERNARCGHTRVKKTSGVRPNMERCVYERYDRTMGEEANHYSYTDDPIWRASQG